MHYPPDFPGAARNRIESEQLRAKQELDCNRTKEPASAWRGTHSEWDKWEFYNYVVRIGLAFAHESCELARVATWTVERVRSETDEFLRRLTIDAYYELGRDRNGREFPRMTDTLGGLLPEVKSAFRMLDGWRKFEADLLAVADPLSVSKIEQGAPNSEAAKRRAAVDAYIEEVFSRTGKRITRKDIWRSVGYKTRTEFERWERNDLDNPNKAAHDRFTRILAEKPHLK